MKQPSIVIIDYGLGNIFSVYKALKKLGYDQVKVSRNSLDIKKAEMDITCDGSASNAIVAAFIPTYQCTRCPCVLRQCFSKSCDDTDKLRRVDCSIDDPTGSLEDCGEL